MWNDRCGTRCGTNERYEEFAYDIEYKKGSENVAFDALSRIAGLSSGTTLKALHNALSHPGITRLWEYIQRHKLPFSFDDVKTLSKGAIHVLNVSPVSFAQKKHMW